MTTAIVIGMKRTDLMEKCLYSLYLSSPRPKVIVVANDEPTGEYVSHCKWVELVYPGDNFGFWGGLNLVLSSLPEDEPFCWFGQDVEFHKDWYGIAQKVWDCVFPSGLGVMTFQDGVQNGRSAAHGMTTRRWLQVVFGATLFPSPPYRHFFCDSELSQRTKDFSRYFYCHESIVKHNHEMSGFSYPEEHIHIMHNDKLIENERYKEWRETEHIEAFKRMAVTQ